MRRLITREMQKKKTRTNQLILGGLLILLLVFSTLGYALGGREDKKDSGEIEHKGVGFVKNDNRYWDFSIQGQDFTTRYNPIEVENFSFSSDLSMADYSNKPLYFIFFEESKESVYEIGRIMSPFVLRTQEACLSKKDCQTNAPIKDCSIDNVIVIKKGENETIYQDKNCVFITAGLENQTKYADVFLFEVLGIR